MLEFQHFLPVIYNVGYLRFEFTAVTIQIRCYRLRHYQIGHNNSDVFTPGSGPATSRRVCRNEPQEKVHVHVHVDHAISA